MKKRKDGRYIKQVLVGYKTDGRPKYKCVYGRTKAETEEKAALLKAEIHRGVPVIEDDMLLSDWSLRWLSLYKANSVEYNTYENYRSMVDRYINPVLGHMRLRDLKKHHIQGFLNDLLDSGLTDTVRLAKLTINQILEQAEENELVYKNVARTIRLPKLPKAKKRALTQDEISLLKKSELDLKERAFVNILLYTGVRRGEALALTKSDLNFESNVLTINKTVIFKENTPELKPIPKSESGIREIPLSDSLSKLLKDYVCSVKGEMLFTMQNGEIVSQSSFVKFWYNIMDKMNTAAGGSDWKKNHARHPERLAIANDITPHLFRHTYCTMLYEAGIDIKSAQYLLGHASTQMTLDVYTHLDKKKLDGTRSKLNEYFSTLAV